FLAGNRIRRQQRCGEGSGRFLEIPQQVFGGPRGFVEQPFQLERFDRRLSVDRNNCQPEAKDQPTQNQTFHAEHLVYPGQFLSLNETPTRLVRVRELLLPNGGDKSLSNYRPERRGGL